MGVFSEKRSSLSELEVFCFIATVTYSSQLPNWTRLMLTSKTNSKTMIIDATSSPHRGLKKASFDKVLT